MILIFLFFTIKSGKLQVAVVTNNFAKTHRHFVSSFSPRLSLREMSTLTCPVDLSKWFYLLEVDSAK